MGWQRRMRPRWLGNYLNLGAPPAASATAAGLIRCMFSCGCALRILRGWDLHC
jgi:hypothetical protein